MPTPAACAGLALATRAPPASAPARAFRTFDRLYQAIARGDVALDATVRCASRTTTAGRSLVLACLPPAVAHAQDDAPWTARRVAATLAHVARALHVEHAARSSAALERLGQWVVARSGCSLSLDDFAPSSERPRLIAEGEAHAARIAQRYEDGQITDGERTNATVDRWSEVAFAERYALRKSARDDDALAVFAGATASGPAPETLRAMAGLTHEAQGSLSERPVLRSAGSGFDAHDAMQRWSTLRREVLDEHAGDAVVATLLRDLDAVLGEVTVVAHDCGTRHGARVARHTSLDAESFRAAIEGRLAAADVATADGRTLARAGTLLDAALADAVAASDVVAVLVRDPTACAARDGVCARCLGLDPDDATWAQPGDAIGARAAQRIAHEARNWKQRWYHIC